MNLVHSNSLKVFFFVITLTIFLILPVAHMHASGEVSWKIFKEKNGNFEIKYPSNWSLGKYYQDLSSPINMYFLYQGKGSAYAQLTVYADQSLFSNITELVESQLTFLNDQNYKVLQPVQCDKYTIKNITACDVFITYKGLVTEGKPTIKELIIGVIDEAGYEYIIEYFGTAKLYDYFLPVANEMINSFNITKSGFSGSEAEEGLPDLPALPS